MPYLISRIWRAKIDNPNTLILNIIRFTNLKLRKNGGHWHYGDLQEKKHPTKLNTLTVGYT